MTASIIEPGSTLGVLGGGQLGAMFAGAARRMGYRVAVWDPDPDAPAHHLADHSFIAPFSDAAVEGAFSHQVQAVTFEWESVPADLCRSLEHSHPLRPSSHVLRIVQDRIRQKQFFHANRLPVPPFVGVQTPDHLADAVAQIGCPALCKTATAGYDGKGQWRIQQASDVEPIVHAMKTGQGPDPRCIVEQFVEFERELSVLVVRAEDGECRTYPVVENLHERGILRLTLVPALISQDLQEQAAELARQAVIALQGIGVFCVEMFQAKQKLLINEIAPRPHNSGHYTLDACAVSQFEQQVRALCGVPLGETRLLSPAAMVNIIGDEVRSVTMGEGYLRLLSMPGSLLHLYGKRVIRPGRKMGHVTFLAGTAEAAAGQAQRLMAQLASV